ncbi:Uncharacterised protein [Pseudomonas fragi]|uniref:Uncharacterized protein n=1 Tax=Pseudomonas fragi TaxID=296 RepID=A0A449IF22_PSEFR|nr:Uncharacterised protein [Pseudomonas fragi]
MQLPEHKRKWPFNALAHPANPRGIQTTAVPSTSLINQLKGQPCIGGTHPLVVNQLKAGLTVTALTKASEHP